MSKAFTDDIENLPQSKRNYYEINQILSSGNQTLSDYAEKIKNAVNTSLSNCENRQSDYNVFTDLERRSIEIEEIMNKEHKKKLHKLNSLNTSKNNLKENRDNCKLWNQNNEMLNYPNYLIEHVEAYNASNKIADIMDNLSKNDENKRKTESNEKVLDDSLTIVNNYYRFNLLQDLLKVLKCD